MGLAQIIKDDIALMKERFPKLALLSNDGKPPSFAGVLDVCDEKEKGEWYGSFNIRISTTAKYPGSVPRLFETGGQIERIADRHINGDGSCCVAIDHVLLHRATAGLTVFEFMQEFALPYFANQLYYQIRGHYAGAEYEHGFAGVVQFYKETLKISDTETARLILKAIMGSLLPARNMPCICNSGKKFKHCHLQAAEFLSTLGKPRLISDLSGFSHVAEI